jgi:hypothetical protein
MKRKLLTIISILVIVGVLPGTALAAPKPIDYRPMDFGPILREWEATPERIDNTLADAAAEAGTSSTPYTECVLDTKTWLRLNSVSGAYGLADYHLVAEGPLAQIWVQANLAWPAGDPRPTPEITCEQAQYLLGEFENNMYPKETTFFGMPDAHDGAFAYLPGLIGAPADYYFDEAGRQVVLVSNVRDENYFDPTYPIYIAGFYSPSYEIYFDRNVMTIDAYDWANRTGPTAARPYLYEGIFAHEYQHLLHDDYDSDEENFVNEGMSDLAMDLVGYGVAVTGHLTPAADYPENSLVVWGDQGDLEILTDYGQAFLFQYYMMEQFGKPFIQALFHNEGNGISGINSTLDTVHTRRDFEDVFHDWSVAMLLDTKSFGNRYMFKGLDFKLNIGTPSAPNPEAFSTPGAPPWGTDYIHINGDLKKLTKITFNGLDYSIFPTDWTSDGNVLSAGGGDLIDNWAIFETTGGILTFDTYYDIEEFWDFGFVQVSTDGGYNWVSIPNAFTTDLHDPNAHPKVVANLPGLTGWSEAWVNMSYDLSAYAGQNILVAFRYVTDWATYYDGWFIDNVYMDGTLISDGSNAAVFKDITEIVPINNDFTVTFVGQKKIGKHVYYDIKTMRLNHMSEEGRLWMKGMFKWATSVVMLVSFDAPEGADFYADYTYELSYKCPKPRHRTPVHGHGDGTHFDRDDDHDRDHGHKH